MYQGHHVQFKVNKMLLAKQGHSQDMYQDHISQDHGQFQISS